MAYVDFDLKKVVQTFGLIENDESHQFEVVEPIEPSDLLRGILEEFAPVALGFNTEQARREFIISPILTEVKRRSRSRIQVVPGAILKVDEPRGLTGYCDYVISRSPRIYYLESPVVAIVEARREDLIAGMGQCAAEMVAIQLFNEREGTPMAATYGCVSSGNLWRFLKLEGNALFIDFPEYGLGHLARIVGILVDIAGCDPHWAGA